MRDPISDTFGLKSIAIGARQFNNGVDWRKQITSRKNADQQEERDSAPVLKGRVTTQVEVKHG
jgi:hypothetical protein